MSFKYLSDFTVDGETLNSKQFHFMALSGRVAASHLVCVYKAMNQSECIVVLSSCCSSPKMRQYRKVSTYEYILACIVLCILITGKISYNSSGDEPNATAPRCGLRPSVSTESDVLQYRWDGANSICKRSKLEKILRLPTTPCVP